MITATFGCARCGGQAAVAELLEATEAPRHRGPATPSTWTFGGRRATGSRSEASTSGAVPPQAVAALRAALRRSDPGGVAAVNPDWAPFYCPRCRACYCQGCWEWFTDFDDWGPGSSILLCPRGHREFFD